MEYVVTRQEQPAGSDAEYRAAQQRVVETDEPADLQYLATAYAPACLTVEPVVHVPGTVLAGTRGTG